MTNREWFTLQQIADELGLHIETIRAYVREGKIIAYKFGRDYRVKKEDLDIFIEQRRAQHDSGT